MARGREIAARLAAKVAPEEEQKRRAEVLARYIEGKKIYTAHDSKGNIHAFFFEQDPHSDRAGHPMPRLRHGAGITGKKMEVDPDDLPIASERNGPSHPSEQFIARIALAVNAVTGTEGIPEYSARLRQEREERKRRDDYRNRMGAQVIK